MKKSTFQIMREMIFANPPTKMELAAAIVENSDNPNYTIEKAKKTVPVRLNNLKSRGFGVQCKLHEDGKYRYHFVPTTTETE